MKLPFDNKACAKILQDCLEDMDDARKLEAMLEEYPQHKAELQGDVQAIQWLDRQRDSREPAPDFLQNSRSRLEARIQRTPRSNNFVWLRGWLPLFSLPVRSRQLALQVAMVLLLVISFAASSERVWHAAYAWLPGDSTYPLKTLVEGARLVANPGAAAKAQLHIEFARQRLIEVQCLIFEGRFEYIAATVTDFEGHVAKALQGVGKVARRDPLQAKLLANALEETFAMHTRLVLMLSGTAPQQYQAQFEKVRLATEAGVSMLRETLTPGGGFPAGMPVAGVPEGSEIALNQAFAWLPPYSFVGRARNM